MRYTLVIYDIADDNLRNKVSEVCKDFGLMRIQKSAFLGPQTPSKRKELTARLRTLIDRGGCDRDNIQVFELDPAAVRSRIIIGRPVVEAEGAEVVIYV